MNAVQISIEFQFGIFQEKQSYLIIFFCCFFSFFFFQTIFNFLITHYTFQKNHNRNTKPASPHLMTSHTLDSSSQPTSGRIWDWSWPEKSTPTETSRQKSQAQTNWSTDWRLPCLHNQTRTKLSQHWATNTSTSWHQSPPPSTTERTTDPPQTPPSLSELTSMLWELDSPITSTKDSSPSKENWLMPLLTLMSLSSRK